MKPFLIFYVLLLSGVTLSAQIQYADDAQYRVEKAQFQPPTQAVIDNFEGSIATPFMANDQDNVEILLERYQGKHVILWFWEKTTPGIQDMIRTMNMVGMDYEQDAKLISFVTEGRAAMNEFLATHDVRFSVIPNGGILGEQMYGGSLGFPRIFFLDSSGVIRKVIPGEYFTSNANVRGMIDDIMRSMIDAK